MLRLFGLFGKSPAIHALDDALRGAGVHPILVPEAVKITVLRLLKRDRALSGPDPALEAAAQVLGYCILGHQGFADSNDPATAEHAERRLEAAMDAGDSLDARLVLLTLHAGLMAPDIAERIEVDDD